MSIDVRETIVLKLKGVVVKFAKKNINELIDAKLFENKVQESVYDVFRTHEYNPNITFDLNRIGDYAEEHLQDTFVAYFNESDLVKRDELKRMIYLDAYQELKATTLDDKNIIYVCIQSILDTIEDNYLSETSDHLKYIANKVVDDLSDVIDRYSKEIESVIIYNNSFAQCIDTIQESTRYSLDYHYLNPKIGFYGREKDIQYLDNFINNPELDQPKDGVKVQYTIITGTGGMGKSKLLYHYKKIHEVDFDKKYVFLTHNKITELSSKTNFQYRRDLVLIVDYASESAEELGELINKMINSSTINHKIHFILLEREGYQSEFISKNTSYLPNWFNKFKDKFDHDSAWEYMYKKENYSLNPLKKDDYLNIVDNISTIKSKQLSDKDKKEVYDKYIELSTNEKLRTPLILILLTDYFIDCKTKKTRFEIHDADTLMKYTIERDRKHWLKTLCDNDKDEQKHIESLLMYATAVGGWSFEELDGPLKEASKYILDKYDSDELLLNKFGDLIRNNDEEFILMPIEPDVIGEYFVIDYLLDHRRKIKGIVKVLWGKYRSFTYFLSRCVETYANNERFVELVSKHKLFKCSSPHLTAALYINLSNYQNITFAPETIRKLEELNKKYPDEKMAMEYASGLFNLLIKQEGNELEGTIDKLRIVSDDYQNNEVIAILYAQGLVNLTNNQEEEERHETIKKLESLRQAHLDRVEIAIAYAKGLFNLSIAQEVKDCQQTVEKLEHLSNTYPHNEEIAIRYAKGLVNLSSEQESKDCQQTVEKLEHLSNTYSHNEEIAIQYAKGLVNLSLKQEESQAIKTLDKVEEVVIKHYDNDEMREVYRISLQMYANRFNLDFDEFYNSRLEKLNKSLSED